MKFTGKKVPQSILVSFLKEIMDFVIKNQVLNLMEQQFKLYQ